MGRKWEANGARTGGKQCANRGARFQFYFCCAPASTYALCENERAHATPFQTDAKARMSAAISPLITPLCLCVKVS